MEALIARAVQILIALGGAYLLTLWFALVVWTFQDIQARSRSVVAQIFSTLVVMIFSIPGLLVYLILRPRYTLDDAFQRSLEEEYLMQDLEELPLCPGCQQYVEDEWVFCPNCRTELRDNCVACDRLIDLRWEICPYCGTEQYEDEDMLPAPPMQPVITPSPQYLGRPQLTPIQAYHLSSGDEHTRPIIPATVRVDLRSGDIATEVAPELPFAASLRVLDGIGAPRRVTLDGGNGVRESSEPEHGDDDLSGESTESADASVDESADGESLLDQSVEDAPGESEEIAAEEVRSESGAEVGAAEVESTLVEPEPEPEEPPAPKKRTRKRRAKKTTHPSKSDDPGKDDEK